MTTAAIPILYVCQGSQWAVSEIRAGNLSANFTTVKKKTSVVLDYKRKQARNGIPTAAH